MNMNWTQMRIFAALILMVLCSACAHLVLERPNGAAAEGAPHRVEIHSFVWGFAPRPKLEEAALCPNSHIAVLDFRMDSPDVWLSIVTLGIYVPYRVDVVCEPTHNSL